MEARTLISEIEAAEEERTRSANLNKTGIVRITVYGDDFPSSVLESELILIV